MKEITYSVGMVTGKIHWAAAEHFSALEEKNFKLGEMEAVKIEQLEEFSITAKILLSAVAGAVIQHLIDEGVETEQIFKEGTFIVQK